MAGTRLAIQTLVIVQLLFVVLISVRHGFCRTSCQRGNLTKDLPLVPGLVPGNSNIAVVQAQWWEDALCNPITALSDAFMSDSGGTISTTGHTEDSDDGRISVTTWSEKLKMSLVVENATQLPHWIDIVSSGLHEIDEIDKDSVISFESLLSSNPMGLEIIPPSLLEQDEATVASIWSHYKKHGSKRKPSERPSQERMVVYIPSWMSIHEITIGWKAFDVSSTDDKSSTTMILPLTTTEPGTEKPSSGQLQPLVEDWMARSILARQKWKSQNDDSNSNHNKTRLTREFPIEHFMAVLMPLLFPLMMPFLISLIKEYKRYKELTASKKKTEESNASSAQLLEAPAQKTKSE